MRQNTWGRVWPLHYIFVLVNINCDSKKRNSSIQWFCLPTNRKYLLLCFSFFCLDAGLSLHLPVPCPAVIVLQQGFAPSLCSSFLQPGTQWELFPSIQLHQLLYFMLVWLWLLVAPGLLWDSGTNQRRKCSISCTWRKNRVFGLWRINNIWYQASLHVEVALKVHINWYYSWFQKSQQSYNHQSFIRENNSLSDT